MLTVVFYINQYTKYRVTCIAVVFIRKYDIIFYAELVDFGNSGEIISKQRPQRHGVLDLQGRNYGRVFSMILPPGKTI